MARHRKLTSIMLGGAALIAVGTAAQAMGLGSAECSLGKLASGPVGSAVGSLLGFVSSFAGGWFSNRFHDGFKQLEYELNSPDDVLRNEHLRRLVTKAIELGIRAGVDGSIKDESTVRSLEELERLAVMHFKRDSAVAQSLELREPQIERFFTGRWEDFARVDHPSEDEWHSFLTAAAGDAPSPSMRLAINVAAASLAKLFPQLLFNNAKLASESDRPAHAALELMLIRTLATTLAAHGEQLSRVEQKSDQTLDELSAVKSELIGLKDALQSLPQRLDQRLVIPSLVGHDSLRISAEQTAILVPRAVDSISARLDMIDARLIEIHRLAKETRDVVVGDRTLKAKLPVVGDMLRDNGNREWRVCEVLSIGSSGCVVRAESRGQQCVFKLSVDEDSARHFARETEAVAVLQRIEDPDARFCTITASYLPLPAQGVGPN